MARSRPKIDSIRPAAAIPGGSLEIRGTVLAEQKTRLPLVEVGSSAARLIVCEQERLIIKVPLDADTDGIRVVNDAGTSNVQRLGLGRLLTSEVHPVANPAVDAEGNIYTTFSGPRGKKVPVSLYKISAKDRSVTAFLSGIVNPTGLAVLADGTLLVSSRQDGTIYSISPDAEVEVFAEGMGVATGLAVDKDQNVYVGDRTGTVFKIDRQRQIFVHATLEPSVAAYHLAYCEDEGLLYVSAPSTSSFEHIHRIHPDGDVEPWFGGFGRPQGIAFDARGRLHICASMRGRRGVFRLTDDHNKLLGHFPMREVAGQSIVGLAFTSTRSMLVATDSCIFEIPGMN